MCDWMDGKRHAATARSLGRRLDTEYEDGCPELLSRAVGELNEYFAGVRTAFSIPMLAVGTEFQRRVWSELMNIPYGSTISYATLAGRTGNPRAVRAVASAVGANPLSILVPCHRVMGSDGNLTGYAGGLEAKRGLLDIELLVSQGCARYAEHIG